MRRPESISGLVHVGLDVLASKISDKTKKVLLQVGNVIKDAVDGNEVEQWQNVGFASRPPNPQAGKAAAQVVILRTSDRDIAIAGLDLRGLDLYGQLGPGDTCVYAAGEDGTGQARALFKGNGSISLYTKVGNTADGKGMIVQLDAENDAIRITNGAGYGLIIDKDGPRLFAGDKAGLSIGSDGKCSLLATDRCQLDGSYIVFGQTEVPPVPGVNSVCFGPAGIAAIASTKVYCAA